jgi:hypothetical protein
MQPWLVVVLFAESFLIYSFLRRFDERSTARLAAKIDLQKHEVNPTITWLAKKVGLRKAFLVTWLVIATGVATADVFINEGFPYGVPVFALIVGFGHILAAANNKHVSYLVDKFGPTEFERQHEENMRELSSLGFGGKLRLLFNRNPASLIMLVMAIPLLSIIGYAMVATELFTVVVNPMKLPVLVIPINVGFCFIVSFILIEFTLAIAPFILASRFSHSAGAGSPGSPATKPGTILFEVPVSVVEQALESARTDDSTVVKIAVPIPTGEA